MEENKTESVRIDSEIVQRVKRHVKDSRQTIGGYIAITLDKALSKIEKRRLEFQSEVKPMIREDVVAPRQKVRFNGKEY